MCICAHALTSVHHVSVWCVAAPAYETRKTCLLMLMHRSQPCVTDGVQRRVTTFRLRVSFWVGRLGRPKREGAERASSVKTSASGDSTVLWSRNPMFPEIIYFNLCTDASNLTNFQRHTHNLCLPPVLLNTYIYPAIVYVSQGEQGEKDSQSHNP